MAELNFPSMFDTRQAMDRQMQEDAHKAGVSGGAGKRYGMYYNSSLLGDQDIAFKRSIGGMLGIGGDPRMQQQQALDEIMAQFPNPQTPEDFVEISNALGGVGLHSYAEAAMDMANEVRTSMPARKTIKGADGYNYYVDTGERVLPEVTKTEGKPETYKDVNQATRYLTSGTYNGVDYLAGDLVPGESAMGTSTTLQTAEQIDLAEFLVSPEYQSGKKTVADWQRGWNLATSAGTSQKYSTTEVKTEDEITGKDRIETWRVDPDGQITDKEPLFTQIKDADDGGASTSMGLAMQLLQDNPEFKTAVAANDSATINLMIKETLEAITPDDPKDREFRLVEGVWRYVDGDQEKVFSVQNEPVDAEAAAVEMYAKYFEEHPELFNTPEGNIKLAKQLVGANLSGTDIFSDLMSNVSQDGVNAIRLEELTVRAIERLSENYVDSGVGGMDSLLAPIEASIAANMKQEVVDGKVVWKGELPGWDLKTSLDRYLPGSKGYAARQFAGQAASLINTVLRQRSGAAVTEHEWDRLVQEFTGGRIKTSAQFANWVGRMRDYNEKTKGYIMAGYEPVVQNRFMANKGSYMTINPETELGLVPIGGWFRSSTDGIIYRRDI